MKTPQTALEVRSQLLSKGFTVSQWSKAHGYKQQNVSRVLHHWIGRTQDCPRGLKTREILRALGKTLGRPLNPYLLKLDKN